MSVQHKADLPGRIDRVQTAEDTSKQRLRLWLRILKVSRRVEGEVRERLRSEFATTLPRFDVLAALDREADGLRMSELSGVLKVSNGNVTGIVDRLVTDGLIVRSAVAGDRRAMVVRLTGKGREEFARLSRIHEDWIDELLGAVNGEQAERLTKQLGKIADYLDYSGGHRS